MNRSMIRKLCVFSILFYATGHAEVVASWNFNGGTVGSAIVSAVDSISGFIAVPAAKNSANPKYAAGNGGNTAAGFGGISGILEVTDNSGVLGAGFTALTVTLDADLAADVTATTVLVRNGHINMPFNIYLLSGNIIGVQLQDAVSGVYSAVRTAGAALSANTGWQTVSVVWKNSSVSIYVDGVAQTLSTGGTAATIATASLKQSDAPMGIGGLRRTDGSISQLFNGSLDNIVISKADPVERGAAWSFDEGSVGADIVSSADSVFALLAVPSANNINNPVYVVGSAAETAAGFAGISGILEVDEGNTKALGSGFSKLSVIFDVDLAADAIATAVLVRNGHINLSYNIYLLPGNIIAIQLQDAASGLYSTVKTAGSALSADAGWQNVSIIWDGSSVSIYVNGIAQMLYGGATSAAVSTISLMPSDAPLGIGGLRRSDGSVGLFLNGSLDNLVIRNATPFIELFGITAD